MLRAHDCRLFKEIAPKTTVVAWVLRGRGALPLRQSADERLSLSRHRRVFLLLSFIFKNDDAS
jgi:hypothetical protein